MHMKDQSAKFIGLGNIFTSEVQVVTTQKSPACWVYQASNGRCKRIMLRFASEWFK